MASSSQRRASCAGQVVALQAAFPAAREVPCGDAGAGAGARAAEFELPLALPAARGRGGHGRGGARATLCVRLPASFPDAAPSLRVHPPLSHPWVDRATGQVSFKRTRQWDAAGGSSLARTVQDVVATLGAAPVAGGGGAAAGRHTAAEAGAAGPGAGAGAGAQAYQQQRQRASATKVPAVPEAFPALRALSDDELLELATNSTAFDAFAAQQGNASQLADMVAQAQNECKTLAEGNLALEPDIKNGRGHLAIVRATELGPALEAYRTATRKQAEAQAAMSPAGLVERLAMAAKEADDESEALQNSLVDTPSDELDRALDRYLGLRKAYHLRNIYLEAARVTFKPQGGQPQQLAQQQQQQQQQPAAAQPLPPQQAHGQGQQAPLPARGQVHVPYAQPIQAAGVDGDWLLA